MPPFPAPNTYTHSAIQNVGPGWVAQLVRALSQYSKVVGSIPGKVTFENQPVNTQINGTTELSLSLSNQ